MPHQERVLDLTEHYNRVAYYLDMGLGKTFVGAEKMYLLNNPVNLVVCQKSKVDDWVEHFKEYYPNYQVYNLRKKSECLTFLEYAANADLYHEEIVGVVNYETAFRRSSLAQLKDYTLMLDESQLISNENAKRSRFILKLKPESVILLSGTPTAGKYEKLWSQVRLLGWNISKKDFYRDYICTKLVDFGIGFMQEVVTGYKNVDQLKRKLTEHGAVFMKTCEVLELPEQIEQTIYVNKTKEYNRFMKNDYIQLEGGVELVGDNSLTKILYARQLCGQYHADKLRAFSDLLESTEDRLIVFYNFTAEYLKLSEIVKAYKRPQSVINGQGRHLEEYDRCDNSVTFIQYQAGAMGGNFQKANKIVYFTLPLGKGSCDLWEQSKKRIHRIGQTEPCFYYYLLVRGSIEEKNLKSLKVGKDYVDELFKKH
jgi:SNF2 family DNA or RNA helicase